MQRAPADRPGPDITDPLLTSETAALERGRTEIDANCSDRATVSVSGPHRRWVQAGALVEFHGRRSTWKGIVNRCALTITRDGDNFTATRSLEIERV